MRRSLISRGEVLLSIDADGIARLELNRPESSNSMSLGFVRALHEAVMRCHTETAVRVVLLTARGKNFCSGGDIREFAARGDNLPEYTREVGAWLASAVSGLINLSAPVITVVQGFAAGGGGIGLVCASDIVVAGESAKFMSGAVRVGMAPDAGTTVTLTQLVGLRKALFILLTNPTLTSTEALEMGLVSAVVSDDLLLDEAETIAAALAASSPLGLAATKHLVWHGLGSGVDAQLPIEARVVAELSGTADSREGLASVIERRPPVFQGR